MKFLNIALSQSLDFRVIAVSRKQILIAKAGHWYYYWEGLGFCVDMYIHIWTCKSEDLQTGGILILRTDTTWLTIVRNKNHT